MARRVASSKSEGVGAVVDEDDVEVAGVRQLAAGEAAEGDDRERQRRLQRFQRHLQAGFGEGGDVGPDLGDRCAVQHVAGHDPEQVAALPPRRAARWRSSTASRQPAARRAFVDELGLGQRAQLVGVGEALDEVDVALKRRRRRGGVVPTRWQSRRAVSGDSRNARVTTASRWRSATRLRTLSRPRSGSGLSLSQPSSSGSICCIRRDVRVKPRVSSRTAARVRRPSEKPKALRRASMAPGRASSSSSPLAKASRSGRK